jgi:hypothetical protein
MSVYKYVTAEGALRYLNTWALRITPPNEFNDPFELRPAYDLSATNVLAHAQQMWREHYAAELVKEFLARGQISEEKEGSAFADRVIAFLMYQMSAAEEAWFLGIIREVYGEQTSIDFTAFREDHAAYLTSKELLLKTSLDLHKTLTIQWEAWQQTLPRFFGVLCLSRCENNPLMWAHYADSHKGALLEFDELASCFCQDHKDGNYGILHEVMYAERRPLVGTQGEASALASLILTKSIDWSYERELRMLLPLSRADHAVTVAAMKLHLINAPSAALRSITIGCRASKIFTTDILRIASARRIPVRKASLDDQAYCLSYEPVEWQDGKE